MDPIKVDFSKKDRPKNSDIVIPPERMVLKIIFSILCSLVFAAGLFYFMLPAINIESYDLYIYIAAVVASYVVFNAIFANIFSKPEYIPYVKKRAKIPAIIVIALAVVVGIGYLVSSEFFRAKDYSQIIVVDDTGNFASDVSEEDIESFQKIPKLDNDAATQIANRALGEMPEYVSQFTVSAQSTQINYQGKPVRVVPLEYDSIIKWFYNTKSGLPGYVVVDMADENAELVKDRNIKYSTAEHFNKNLKRHIRFEYPTYMFTDATFEIDETGVPYWICPYLDKTIGLFGGSDIKGVVVVDAGTGACVDYTIDKIKSDASLSWIDRAYDSDLIVQQYNFYGKYRDGFWNSVLGQDQVISTTDGYNYIAMDDDVWLYTGVTSVTNDNSIIGFVLVNQRTKESRFYSVAGGTEASAQEAAQGRVKDLGYNATFPLLINVDGQPTYFMSLKDDTNIVQQYALINVKQYNKIGATGDDLETCLENYKNALKANGISVTDIPETPDKPNVPEADAKTATGTVEDIRTAVKGGESYYYIKLSGNEAYFSISASKAEAAVILNKGDTVTVSYSGEGSIIPAASLEIG